jgi:predicted NAD-dependent protein-ADP-ribosyltransferase YbiA (DUF1768 family)
MFTCKRNKVLNPKTCIFNKTCKKGYIRNKKFECIKKKTDSQFEILIENISRFLEDIENMEFMKKLYDDRIVFCYLSNIDTSPFPGTGEHEDILEVYKSDYEELSLINEWRHKLSNFWIQPFYLLGKKWASVEHFYQALKFKNTNIEFFNTFSLDSNSELSKDPILAKFMGSESNKKRKWKGQKIRRDPSILIDPEFYSTNMHKKAILVGNLAKYYFNEDLKEMLLLTKHSKLVHPVYKNGGSFTVEIMYSLMYVRYLMRLNSPTQVNNLNKVNSDAGSVKPAKAETP